MMNMAISWRRKRAAKKSLRKEKAELELTIPAHFRCPISLDLMKDPVTLSTGITYDRESIEKWIEDGNQTCPVTNQVLTSFDQIPNHAIRRRIQEWCVENRANGVERIPTPRVPITAYDVSDVCSKIMSSAQIGDAKRCKDLVEKIKVWAKESERNKNLVVENGVGYVLAASFESFSSVSIENNSVLLEEILFMLTWMFPLGVEGQAKLGSAHSLRCMGWFLVHGDNLSSKKAAILALKELLSLDQKYVKGLAEIVGLPEALVKVVKNPICPKVTKASLTIIYYMVSQPEETSCRKMVLKFLDLGMFELALETVVEAEKSLCEKALGVLDGICSSKEGRERAHTNALTVPVLVKKILRVSSLGTEFCISMLWKLGKNDQSGNMLVEALEVGAFQKVLLMLQINCGEGTKEKATEMLKMMNHYKNRLDCFDSVDFKYLKRSY